MFSKTDGKLPIQEVLDLIGKEEFGFMTDEQRNRVVIDGEDLSNLNVFDRKKQEKDMLQRYYSYISNAKKSINDIEYIVHESNVDFPHIDDIIEKYYDFDNQRFYLSSLCQKKSEYHQYSENFNFEGHGFISELPSCNRPYIDLPIDMAKQLFYQGSDGYRFGIARYTFKISDKDIHKIESKYITGTISQLYRLKGNLDSGVFQVRYRKHDEMSSQVEYEFPIHFN